MRVGLWLLGLIGALTGLVGLSTAGAEEDLRSRLEPGGRSTVVTVIDADTVILADGREIRLVGIQTPKLPLGRRNFETWPMAEEAKAALERLIGGRTVEVWFGGRQRDRHGRWLGHLFLTDGTWVQGRMLQTGYGRVYTFPDNRSLIPEMLDLERAARASGYGIWRDPYYSVRTPREATEHIGTFQLIEGVVRNAADVRGRIYLNFGRNWREDFTIQIESEDRDVFANERVNPLAYEDHRIRVRGWLLERNGPMILVNHPEQIEVLD